MADTDVDVLDTPGPRGETETITPQDPRALEQSFEQNKGGTSGGRRKKAR